MPSINKFPSLEHKCKRFIGSFKREKINHFNRKIPYSKITKQILQSSLDSRLTGQFYFKFYYMRHALCDASLVLSISYVDNLLFLLPIQKKMFLLNVNDGFHVFP
jgi:hypothetical protein